MRHLLAACGLFFFFGAPARAEFQVGLLGGPQFAYAHGRNESMATKIREMFGIYGEAAISERLSAQAQLRYLRKQGGQLLNQGGPGDYEYDARYIELPLYVKYRPFGNGSFRPHVFGGPVLGFSFDRASRESPVGGPSLGQSSKEAVKPIELAVAGGLGADFDIGDHLVGGVAVSYALGLTPIARPHDTFQAFHSYVTLGYRWGE